MMAGKHILALGAFVLLAANAFSQTDVTDLYLTNAGFDDNSSWQTVNMAAGSTPNSAEVAGWKLVESAAWSSSATFGYGSAGQANGVSTPATGPDGSASGGALGISTGWGGRICYEQPIALPAGKYRITYAAYNNFTATQSMNIIGFVTESDESHYGIVNHFPYQTWKKDTIILHLTEPTKGKIRVGLGAVSEGSDKNAKVYIDHIKIEAYNAAEALMPAVCLRLMDWTGSTGTYKDTYQEYYQDHHYTGTVMQSGYTVENGTYSADIIFQAHKAWIDQKVDDGTPNAYIKANNVTRKTEVVNNNGFAAYEPKVYHLEDIQVTDGKLSFEVGNAAEGANWLTVKTQKITKMTTPTVNYGAFALPNVPVNPDFWYQCSVPIAGTYQLSAEGETQITYTQDASLLVTDEMPTTTGGILELQAGTLYLKASTSTTVALSATSYGYEIGNATADAKYVQPGQTVSIAFNQVSTNDPDAVLVKNLSGIMLDGKELDVAATENGFSFTVPDLMPQTAYTLIIPAGIIAYEGHAANPEQAITLTTIAVFDGTYFLRTYDGRYLARGNQWNTHAILDQWGLPVKITTGQVNNTAIQFADNALYLYNTGVDAYTDCATFEEKSTWHFIAKGKTLLLASAQQEGRYVKADSGDDNLFTDGSDSNGEILAWLLVTPEQHEADIKQLRAACKELEQETAGLTSKTYLSANPTATAEQFQGTGEVMSGTFDITVPGIYRFSIQAFHRMASNDVAYALHQKGADSPPVYAYFGDTKVQLLSVYDQSAKTSTGFSIEGNNYPNDQAGALTAFKEGLYQNVIFVRVGADQLGTWNYGIRNQGNPGNQAHWTCYATDGIEITRYYDPETDGLDAEDQEKADLIESLKLLVGDVNNDGNLSVTDVMKLVNMIMTGEMTCELPVADLNGDGHLSVTDVLSLVNVIMGNIDKRYIDMTYTYAQVNATVAAEQLAAENADGASYILDSATCTLTGLDVAPHYNMEDWVTTLHIEVPFDQVESVSIFATDHTPIAGPMTLIRKGDECTYSYPEGEKTPYAASSQSDVVTVRGDALKEYTAYLLPQTLTQGVLVTVHTTDGHYYSQHFEQIIPQKANTLQFTTTEATNLWMSTLPGNTYFSLLSTPGAHNACTSGVNNSMAKCQSENLDQLLANGVRAFDLRPRYNSSSEDDIKLDNLTIYHGGISTGVKFKDAMDVLIGFVKNNPSEAVSVIMQKEDSHLLFSLTDYSETWRASIRECFSDESRSPYIMPDVRGFHTLDQVRGKVSVVCKNPYGNSSYAYRDIVYGAIIENWPDNGAVADFSCGMTQAWNWTDCRASVEDAYKSSTTQKESEVMASLTLASGNTTSNRYVYTFLSIADSPATYAAVINPKTVEIIGTLNGSLGYVYADYQGSVSNGGQALLKAVIDQNAKYVYQGQSRMGRD